MKENLKRQEWLQNLSTLISARREELNLGQKDLAKMIGANTQYVKKLEDIKIFIEPRLSTLFKLSSALDIAPSKLIDKMFSDDGE